MNTSLPQVGPFWNTAASGMWRRPASTPGCDVGISAQDYRTIAANDQGQLSLTWRARDVWEGNSSGGSYTLTYAGQSTIRPTDVRVTIHAPPGTDIIWTSEPMAIEGGTATWEGSPASGQTLEVRFRAPLPLRYLRDVTRPVLGG